MDPMSSGDCAAAGWKIHHGSRSRLSARDSAPSAHQKRGDAFREEQTLRKRVMRMGRRLGRLRVRLIHDVKDRGGRAVFYYEEHIANMSSPETPSPLSGRREKPLEARWVWRFL